MTELNDKVILITGAGKGRGRALAEALAECGAVIAANDVSPVNVDEVVAGIKARGGRASSHVHDVAKKVAVQTMIHEVEDEWGRIDVLIQHAAVEPRVPLLDMDEWDWHRVLDVNLTGAFLMLQSVGRTMRAQGGGLVVHLVPGTGPGSDLPGAYAASMNGLAALTRRAADELAPYGIRVAEVATESPDLVKTVIGLCKG